MCDLPQAAYAPASSRQRTVSRLPVVFHASFAVALADAAGGCVVILTDVAGLAKGRST